MITPLYLLSSLLAFGQAPAAISISKLTAVNWGEVTTNTLGQPETIKGYELAVLPSGGDLNIGIDSPIKSVVTAPDGWKGTVLTTLLATIPTGPHRLQVRTISTTGLFSVWSPPLDVVITTTPPAAPTGLRVVQ